MDVFEILKQDHQKVSGLFDQIEATQDGATRRQLFTQIKQELDLHTQVEETILYPELKQADETREIAEEAYEEHAEAKQLLARIDQTPPTDSRFDDLLTELRTAIEHHVSEEEGEMFPKARKVLDQERIDQISQQVAAAKQRGKNAAASS